MALLCCVWAAPAEAQDLEPVPAANSLRALPGQNAAQRDMARSIDEVCPTLVANTNLLATPAQRDLKDICRSMVQTANDLLERDVPTPFTRDLTLAETNAALQAISGEELQAPQEQATDVRGVQVANVFGRLQALRAATAGGGISVAGLSLQGGDAILVAESGNTLRLLGGAPDGPAAGGAGDAVVFGQGDDLGAFFGDRVGVFATGSVKFGDRDGTGEIAGFDFTTPGITVGADYRITDQFILGAAFGYSYFEAEFDESAASPSGQELDSNSYLLSLFGTYYLDNGFFVDGIATVGYSGYDSERHIVIPTRTGGPEGTERIDRRAEGDFDAWQYSAAANVGYDALIGPVRLTPRVQLEYLHADIDGFTEEGAFGLNLEFGDQEAESLVIRPGLQASYPISVPFGVVSPFVRGEFVHEFLGDDDAVEVRYAADPTNLSAFEVTLADDDRNYGAVGGGVAVTLQRGWSLFADYEALVGLEDFEVHRVAAGFRKDFL